MTRRKIVRLPARLVGLALLLSLPEATSALANGGPLVPRFTDETASSGITSTYRGDWEFMVGGGVASFDCNADGFADRHWQIGHGTILWPSVFAAIAQTGASPRLILELRDKAGVLPSAAYLKSLGIAE